MSVNWQDIVFSFLGGLGLFLFSIKYMGDGLQQAAGDKLRYYIDKYTSNPFLGVLIGIVMTALIQSSSGRPLRRQALSRCGASLLYK